MSTFKKAVKTEAKLRMAIAGPSGSGKTYTALAIAVALANGKPVALVDTEHGSASKYADLFAFDVLELHPPFHPDRFVEAITDAAKSGYGVIILDSLTHAWSGTGGLLEIVDQIATRMRSPNSFAAWKDATPIQNRLVEAIVAADLHVIATMRSKQEYVVQQDERGKQTPRKVGMAPQQREGCEYEFDVFGEMDQDNTMVVTKSRCPALSGAVIAKPGTNVAQTLAAWLHGVTLPSPAVNTTTGEIHEPPAPVIAQAEVTPVPSGASPNGQQQAKPTKPPKPPVNKDLQQIAIMCKQLFGDKADEARAWLAGKISNGATTHASQLTPEQQKMAREYLEADAAKKGWTRNPDTGHWEKPANVSAAGDVPANAAILRKINLLGRQMYGDEWVSVYHLIIQEVAGAVKPADQLTADQAGTIAANLERQMADMPPLDYDQAQAELFGQ